VPWVEAARGFFIPTLSTKVEFWTVVVAIFGTTISPYLFFWQAAQEVEDIKDVSERKPLVAAPKQGPDAINRIEVDTYIGMAFSNLVALAIMFTTAATLHAAGTTDIQTSSQAAEALRPIAGSFAFAIFTLGIVGTGLLAVPVLAGSSAYALGEARKWPTGLARKPLQAKAFYATIVVSTLAGITITFSPLDPIKALFWSAVINGVVSVPVMAMMMLITSNKKIMGKFVLTGALKYIGWLATAVMAFAALGMAITAQF
jgi:Mn2+/Fe2+ NRAMP family transporter